MGKGNFVAELKVLLMRISENKMSEAEVKSFIKKIDSLQLSSESDMIRKDLSGCDDFTDTEKQCYEEALKIVKSGFFRTQFFE